MDDEFIRSFEQLVADAAARMLQLSDEAASRARGPGKWSRKEIVGHLIDSAVNNQSRFVRAQMQDDLVFPGYDQDAWVRIQRYRERSWADLVFTWQAFNAQVAATMRATSAEQLDRVRPRHNLGEIGFEPLPAGTPPTLGFLIRDYVVHLRHHLGQVWE